MAKFSNNNDRFEQMLMEFKTPFDKDASSWEAIQAKIDSQKTPVVSFDEKPKNRSYLLAASIVGLITLSSLLLINQNKNRHSTYTSEKTMVLPDGSTVHMFKNSSLSYNETENTRNLSLNGGAIFSVEKGAPFKIKTRQGMTTVLGTVLSVESREGHFSVKCSEGKVEVKSENDKVILEAGEATRYSNETLLPFTFTPDEINDRKNGIFHFEKAPLAEVFMQLENEFQVKINPPLYLNDKHYSGNFSNKDLSEALDLVAIPMGLKYNVNGKEIEFKEKILPIK